MDQCGVPPNSKRCVCVGLLTRLVCACHRYTFLLSFFIELPFLILEPTGTVPQRNDDHSDAISITEDFVFGNSIQDVVYVRSSCLRLYACSPHMITVFVSHICRSTLMATSHLKLLWMMLALPCFPRNTPSLWHRTGQTLTFRIVWVKYHMRYSVAVTVFLLK